jgi:hypothetical protein
VEATAGAKARLSMDDEQLLAYLNGKIETDTLTIAPHVNADRVLMVLTKYDKTVPYESQLRLRDAMGNPEAITLPTGHNMAAAYLFYLRSRVLKFFDRKLADDHGPGTAVIPGDLCDEDADRGSYPSARSRSAMRSSSASMPTDSRIN